MLTPLATVEQFAARLPGGIGVDDYDRAEAALQDASALVRLEAQTTWVDEAGALTIDLPDVVVAVTIAAARRAFVNPDGLASESIQDYSSTFPSASADIYLTRAERSAVRRAVQRSGLWTMATTRVDTAADVPAVVLDGWSSTLTEELDPFDEGWSG